MLHLSVCLCPVNLRPVQCQRAGTAIWCQIHSAHSLLMMGMCPALPQWAELLHSGASQPLVKPCGVWRGHTNPYFADWCPLTLAWCFQDSSKETCPRLWVQAVVSWNSRTPTTDLRMANSGGRGATFSLRHSWPPPTQIACTTARERTFDSVHQSHIPVAAQLNYGNGAEERAVLALFVQAVIQVSTTNPAQLINTGSRERRSRNNDAVKSSFMNMEQCLILHYYGCYFKHTPHLCAGDCYFLSCLDWASDGADKSFKGCSWNEIKNTKGSFLEQFLEGYVVRTVQK